MNPPQDLTRWNRGGLSRFRYIQGNAVEYLEALRALLAAKFPAWNDLQLPGPAGEEPPLERQQRLLAQYHGSRRDYAWEIIRSFARACHILTEYVDAYANEAYLGTATQWDNVRKLVEMLDYHPAPPASASTLLILAAKPGKKGKLEAGFQVKYSPPTGGPAVVFETLEDLEVDAGLNALRLKDHDRSPDGVSGSTVELEGSFEDVAIGEPVVVEKESTGAIVARLVAGVRVQGESTTLTLSDPLSPSLGFTKGDMIVHLQPQDRLAPLGPAMTGTTGETALHLKDVPSLAAGDIVYVSDGKEKYYRRIKEVSGRRLTFYQAQALGPLDLGRTSVSRPRGVSVSSIVGRTIINEGGQNLYLYAVKIAGDLQGFLGTLAADVPPQAAAPIPTFPVRSAAYEPVDINNREGGGYTTLRLLEGTQEILRNPQALLVKPAAREWEADSYLKNDQEQPFPRTLRTEAPKKTSAGDLAVVASGNQYAWGRLDQVAVDEEKNEAGLTVSRWFHRGGGRYYLVETRVYGHFKHQARLTGWRENGTPLAGKNVLEAEEAVPELVKVGRRLFIEQESEGGTGSGLEVFVTDVNEQRNTIQLDTSFTEGDGFTYGNTVVRGSVVKAGHGERRPEKVLGSGDATQSNQSFLFDVAGVSFVADATQASGVRAAIEVMVEGQTWEQVSTLKDSGPADPHYIVRMTEEGYLRIGSGDGVNGRRLPTGTNNIRIGYRLGNGLAGIVPAGSLEKPAKPHYLVETVRQPEDATGGNDLEDKRSLKERAPATLLTLERAVSLEDFGNLAASHSSLWQARAFARHQRDLRYDHVEVVVIPAGGGKLSSELQTTLTDFLQAHAVPSVRVTVRRFHEAHLELSVRLRINPREYDPELVRENVRGALLHAFALRSRRIGQSLYLSEVYKVVEGITGVINSTSSISIPSISPGSEPPEPVLGPGGDIKVLRPSEDQVISLEESRLTLDYEEFSL